MDDNSEAQNGVIVPIKRADNGRFVAGGPGGPGRKRKDAEREVIDAIASAINPQDIADAILFLIYHPSWRAKEAGVKLYTNNMVGTPVQRKPETDEVYVTLLEKLRENARLRVVKPAPTPVDS